MKIRTTHLYKTLILGIVLAFTINSGGENLKSKVPFQSQTKMPNATVKITQLEMKTKIGKGKMKSIYRWYTFYVENYIDNKETEKKMIAIAKKLPVDNGYDAALGMNRGGMTEVFFFNNKTLAPKLSADGGWNANESQNSWNSKYGKYCVGYYVNGGGENGTFSKGWN